MENNTVFMNKEDEYLSELIKIAIMHKISNKYCLHRDEIIDNAFCINIKISIDDIISKELVEAAINKMNNNINMSQILRIDEERCKKVIYKQNSDIILNDKENDSLELIIEYKINIEERTYPVNPFPDEDNVEN